MAHIGRAYKRFFRRDLSMKPGGYCYLPDAWEWAGLLWKNLGNQVFSHGPNRLEYNPAASGGRTLVWEKRVYIPPALGYYLMQYSYRLTNDEHMVEQSWWIGDNFTNAIIIPHVYVNSSFPNNQLPGTWSEPYPSFFSYSSLGIFRPQAW